MTPPIQRSLLVVIALLAFVLAYTWAMSLVDDSAPVGNAAPSIAPEIKTAVHGKSQEENVATMKSVKPISKQPVESSETTRLVGRIVNADGKGLAGIKIRLRTLRRADRGFFLRQNVTDANGAFVLDDLGPHDTYLLFTEAVAGYPSYRLDGFTLDSLSVPFEIRLDQLNLVNVGGTVVDAEHAPVANFTLTFDSIDSEYPSRTLTSDSSGYFNLKTFPVGKLKIYTAVPEYFRIQGLRTRIDEYRDLTLVIDRGRYSLAGRVLDERGNPIAPARITLNSVISGNEYDSYAYRERLTDASGSFEFTGLGGITHTLGVYANGYKPHVEKHEFQSYSDHLEIRLRR